MLHISSHASDGFGADEMRQKRFTFTDWEVHVSWLFYRDQQRVFGFA
jgi:hypothetical protein